MPVAENWFDIIVVSSKTVVQICSLIRSIQFYYAQSLSISAADIRPRGVKLLCIAQSKLSPNSSMLAFIWDPHTKTKPISQGGDWGVDHEKRLQKPIAHWVIKWIVVLLFYCSYWFSVMWSILERLRSNSLAIVTFDWEAVVLNSHHDWSITYVHRCNRAYHSFGLCLYYTKDKNVQQSL